MTQEKFSKKAIQATIVAMLINLSAGAQYCWSLLGGATAAEHGWTTVQMALPASLMMVFTSLWAIVVGHFNDKTKPKYFVMFGAVCIGLGLVIAGNTSSYPLICFAIIVLMGAASTSFTSNTTPTAQKLAPLKYKGLVAGIVGAGMGWTSFYMSPLIRWIQNNYDNRTAYMAIGIGSFVIIMILAQFLPEPERTNSSDPAVVAAAKAAEEADQKTLYKNTKGLKEAIRTKELWICFSMFAAAGMGGQMMTSQMTKIAEVQYTTGDAAALAVTMLMLLGLSNGLGRLFVSTISDKLGVRNTWSLIFIAQCINILLFRFYTTAAALNIGTFVLGFFYGAAIPLVWNTAAGIFGRRHLGAIYGVITNGFSVAALVGPLVSARIVDVTGSYNPAFLVLALFLVIGFVLSRIMPNDKLFAAASGRE